MNTPTHSRIRSLRLRQKRTLKEVASRCGFTESLLSKIETGKTSPPVATLSRIATALGVSIGELLEDQPVAASVVTTATALENSEPTPTDKGYSFHSLASGSGRLMQPFLFVARRGEVIPRPLVHRGEEFIHVLSGRMKYQVGEIAYTLGPGDSLYFEAEKPHDLEPLTDEVRYLAVFTDRPKEE